jgi:hypothetical protein
MPVMVDDRPLATEPLGLNTVGELLAHLQRDNRLVVHMLIDGSEPDLQHLRALQRRPLAGHTLFVETSDRADMAAEALGAVEIQLAEALRLTSAAVEFLRANNVPRALEKLSGCFGIWHNAQDSVRKVAQRLRLDLAQTFSAGKPITDLLADFARQLQMLRSALENRDYVSLIDTLEYETKPTMELYASAIATLRGGLNTRRAA